MAERQGRNFDTGGNPRNAYLDGLAAQPDHIRSASVPDKHHPSNVGVCIEVVRKSRSLSTSNIPANCMVVRPVARRIRFVAFEQPSKLTRGNVCGSEFRTLQAS